MDFIPWYGLLYLLAIRVLHFKTVTLWTVTFGAKPGLSVFLLGFGLETCADTQKFKFKMNAENEGKFITEGVWKWSRHPNYFGEMVLWWGVYLVCLPNLNLAQSLVGLLSPVTVSLLISLLSGIPPLERSAEKRWGALETYQEYKKNTPVLIPFVHTRFLEYQSKRD